MSNINSKIIVYKTIAAITALSVCSFMVSLHTEKAIAHAEVMEESQRVDLSLNYTDRKILFGSCTYLSDMEVFNGSGETIDPEKVEWSSSDESVATVKFGVIFINDIGKTTITASYDGNTATCIIEVIKPMVSLNKDVLKDRLVGDVLKDWYVASESGEVTVKSGNKKVVKIKEDGSLKVVSLGKSVITAKIKGGNTVKYTMNIKKRHVYINDDETVDLNKYIKNIKHNKDAVWTVSDETCAKIENGIFKPLTCGKITVKTKLNGKDYKIHIRVTNYEAMLDIAMSALNDTLRYPASLSINGIMHTGRSITIDYSSMNRYGGYNRDEFVLKINMNGEYSYETINIYD